MLYTVIRSIPIVIQYIHKYASGLLFQIRTGLSISEFGPWRHEERDTILTMLTPTKRAAHLVMFKISVGRDPKNPTTSFNGQNPTLTSMVQSQLTSFHNPQILRTISSRLDVIHTPTPFPVWGFVMTNGDCHILCARA